MATNPYPYAGAHHQLDLLVVSALCCNPGTIDQYEPLSTPARLATESADEIDPKSPLS